MKKTFKLEHPKIKLPRVVDSVKHDIRTYLKKERKRPLPEEAIYWDFDCKIGQSEDTATKVRASSLIKEIDDLVEKKSMTIFVQIKTKAIDASEKLPEQED